MVYNVIGIEFSCGEFEGRAYDNIIIHAVYPIPEIKGTGEAVERIKIKRSKVEFIPCINDNITVLYNRFKQPESILRV